MTLRTFKNALRNGLAQALLLSRATAPDRLGRGRLSIVTFHRVLPEEQRRTYPYPGLAVTPEELDALLGYFARHFDCGALDTQEGRFARGESTARPLLAVTFDDGQHDNYAHARPVLARHGISASFFIPVEALDRGELLWHDRLGFAALALARAPGPAVAAAKALAPAARLRLVEEYEAAAGARAPEFARLMTWDEVTQLAVGGHEIGSHSMSHRMMPECDDAALAFELEESRRILRTRTGQAVESFCYPNGDADARCAAAAARAGYRRAVTTRWGSNSRGADAFQLRRCDMDFAYVRAADGALAPALLAFRMSGLHPGLR